jgi:hypothetical protein
MTQRKPPPGGKSAAKKGTSRPAGKPGAGSTSKVPTSKVSTSKTATKSTLAKASAASSGRKPPPRKPGKSIVNQKQTPWGLIASVTAVVLFAGAVIGVVIATSGSSNKSSANGKCPDGSSSRYCLPELPAAQAIKGVTYKKEPDHNHVSGTVNYDATPPIGGDHSGYYADCEGTVYPHAIANENAVHPMEHGAVWVTYREGLPQSEVDTLSADVSGRSKVFMSPYPNLKTKVSLQAWGYQLFVNSVTDPRINAFIGALAGNPKITPEVDSNGDPVTCADPAFKAHPSTFGHPLSAPNG